MGAPRVRWSQERCVLAPRPPQMPASYASSLRPGSAPPARPQAPQRLRPCAASTLESEGRAAPQPLPRASTEREQFKAAADALQARLTKALLEEDAESKRILKRLYATRTTQALERSGEVLLGLVGAPVTDTETGQDRIVNLFSYLWEFRHPLAEAEEEEQEPPPAAAGAASSVAAQEAEPSAAAPPGTAEVAGQGGEAPPAASPSAAQSSAEEPGEAEGEEQAGEDPALAEKRRKRRARLHAAYRKYKRGEGVVLWAGTKNPDPSQLGQLTGTVHGLPKSKPCIRIAVSQAVHDAMRARLAAAQREPQGGPQGDAQGDAPALFWRVDKYAPDATITRQYEAVASLGTPWGRREADRHAKDVRRRKRLGLDIEEEEEGRFTGPEERVRCVLLGHPKSAAMARTANKWARNPLWAGVVKAGLQRMAANKDLNRSQLQAIAAAAQSTFTLWQGPPGTGKTKTLLGLLALLCEARAGAGGALEAEDRGPILACADTNAATDNLLEGLAARGINVIRLGIAQKVRESVQHRTLEQLIEADEAYKEVVRVREIAQRKREQAVSRDPVSRDMVEGSTYRALSPRGPGEGTRKGPQLYRRGDPEPLQDPAEIAWLREALMTEGNDLLDHARVMAEGIGRRLLQNAQVVTATCSGAGDHFRLQGLRFKTVILDEATQATEPSVLVPILLRGAELVVLAGDPRQLPPTVLSQAAIRYQLNTSLFERVQAKEGHPGGLQPLLLDTQYRMHTSIAAFPSQAFYGARLLSDRTTQMRPLPAGFPWPNARCHVAVVDAAEGTEQGSVDAEGSRALLARRGYYNPYEADVALRALELVLEGGEELSVALLSPYRGQVNLLTRLLRRRRLERQAEVSTIDGYQGREADVIIVSTVRAGDRLGFLSDERRLNVAITRPKRGLIVVGNTRTLVLGRVLRAWVEWAQRNRCLLTPADLGIEPKQQTQAWGATAPQQRAPRAPAGDRWSVAGAGAGPSSGEHAASGRERQAPSAAANDWSVSGPELQTFSRYDDAEEAVTEEELDAAPSPYYGHEEDAEDELLQELWKEGM